MATAVVSGRVDEDVKRRADIIIRSSGLTVAGVIADVWQDIVETGQVPRRQRLIDEQSEQRKTFESFMEWFEALPPQNEEYADMSDDEILALKVTEYV